MSCIRLRALSVFLAMAAGYFALVPRPAAAEALELRSVEGMWLMQVTNAMQDLIGMLEPIYIVTDAMTEEYQTEEIFRYEALAAIEEARSRLNMIHENTVWMMDILPEPPVASSRAAADLINKIGDPRLLAGDLRVMSDAVISNFEQAVTGSPEAMDQGVIEASKLLDELLKISDFVYEVQEASLVNAHELESAISRADQSTLRAFVRVRKMWFLASLSSPSPIYDAALSELVADTRRARSDAANLKQQADAYKRFLAGPGSAYRTRDAKFLERTYETEEARGNLLREIENVIFQLSREVVDIPSLERSISNVSIYSQYLEGEYRDSMERSGKSRLIPEGISLPESEADL